MTSPKLLTDSKSLLMQRARASSDGLFLHDLAADEVQDRMNIVNRPFNSMAVVSGFPEHWAKALPQAVTTSDDETLRWKHPNTMLSSMRWDYTGPTIQSDKSSSAAALCAQTVCSLEQRLEARP